MKTEKQRLGIGGLLLAASTALIIGIAMTNAIPSAFAGVASLAMAAGALIVGLSEENAGV
ncbi:hypothetical protein [Halocatena pleomorpha]|uniref:Uncharacterized protein n=1 Tax=Halocatena pleomorpha TaxID=1785090 RepID=A0A3P3RI59_9EURY|nr:hypothetical protein [Halocatena pleomorpha]RRJ33092.1 hypothetical protein EIK79_03440 [Halocatena pleomorpha]